MELIGGIYVCNVMTLLDNLTHKQVTSCYNVYYVYVYTIHPLCSPQKPMMSELCNIALNRSSLRELNQEVQLKLFGWLYCPKVFIAYDYTKKQNYRAMLSST